MPDSTFDRLSQAAARGLGQFGRGGDTRSAKSESEKVESFGVVAVGIHSTDDEMADWEKKLWRAQDNYVDWRGREWLRNLSYVAGEQHISYHKVNRRWVPRKSVPWRIRSVYNVCQKALGLRTARLTENKPMMAVQASTASNDDVEKAEYKETLFWYLWDKLALHGKLTKMRRWAGLTGAGYLKLGWDPDAGPPIAATKKVPRFETVNEPVDPERPDLGEAEREVYAGIHEVYIDSAGQELGPVYAVGPDPLRPGEERKLLQDPPEDVEWYHEGEAFADVRSPFNIRFDIYVDDPWDSWYFQDAEVLPLSKIIALFPNAKKKLEDARLASEEERQLFRVTGLGVWGATASVQSGVTQTRSQDETPGAIDKEYLVRETWIFPDNDHLRKLWGRNGAVLITVGGALIHKSSLPEWALEAKPLIGLSDITEEGNHYNKSFLRDLIPIQDDINRTRSHQAEAQAVMSRLVMGAPQGHRINLQLMSEMPAVLLTYRSREHKPEPIQMNRTDGISEVFYASTLSAANDLGQMQDASTGKLPAAGIAAKAIYALQWADERGINEASNLQDIALKRIAVTLDAITRHEYKEMRKVRIVGEDRAYMVEYEIGPDQLTVDVDYHFVPGSMLAKQKEVIRNEMLTLMQAGLVQPFEAKKFLSSATPDVFRRSYDLQHARARRNLNSIVHSQEQVQPAPFEDPEVHAAAYQEFMLSHRYEGLDDRTKDIMLQTWQAYTVQAQEAKQRELQMQAQVAQQTVPGVTPSPQAQPQEQATPTAEGTAEGRGPQDLERQATGAMAPPEGFGQSRFFLQ